jgi:hypothetical protein
MALEGGGVGLFWANRAGASRQSDRAKPVRTAEEGRRLGSFMGIDAFWVSLI